MYTINRIKKFKNIAAFAYDLGGAEHLYSFINKSPLLNKKKISFFFNGPSSKLIKEKNKLIKDISAENLSEFDLILSSTSTGNFEKKVFSIANEKKIEIWAILDHWTNYDNRFEYSKKLFLPNLVLVTDQFALQRFKQIFPNTEVEKIENYFLNKIRSKMKVQKKKNSILYFSEPEMNFRLKSPRLKSLDVGNLEWINAQKKFLIKEIKFIRDSNFFEKNKNLKLIIRLHPKLHGIVDENFVFKEFIERKNTELADALLTAHTCIGKSSYALYISTELGIPTYTISQQIYGKSRQTLPFEIKELI